MKNFIFYNQKWRIQSPYGRRKEWDFVLRSYGVVSLWLYREKSLWLYREKKSITNNYIIVGDDYV